MDDLKRLQAYLEEHHPTCILIPSTKKQPIYAHKDGQYNWEKWNKTGYKQVINNSSNVTGCMVRLTENIVVIDVDDKYICDHFENCDLGFNETVTCETQKGRHYWFMRTKACDDADMYDLARAMKKKPKSDVDNDVIATVLIDAETENPNKHFDDAHALDIKTCGKPGKAPGMISVPPSPNKIWVRPPWEHQMLPLPDKFVEFYLLHRKHNPIPKQVSAKPSGTDIPVPLETLQTIVLDLLHERRAYSYADWKLVLFGINNVCELSGIDYQARDQLIHKFSMRCPSKYNPTSVNCAIKYLMCKDNGIKLGSLLMWAQEDSPEECAKLKDALRRTNPVKNVETVQVDLKEVYRAADHVMKVLNMDSSNDKVVDSYITKTSKMSPGVLHLDIARQGGHNTHVSLDLDTLKLTKDNLSVGYLHQHETAGIPVVSYDLGGIDSNFKAGMTWITTRPCDENLKFTSHTAPRAQIDIINYHNPSARSAKVNLLDINKNSTITAKKKLDILVNAYSGSIQKALSETYGLGNILLVNNMNVTINSNNNNEHNDRHSDTDLVTTLLKEHPEIRRRFCFSPDKEDKCDGLYYCDPTSNFWRKCHNSQIELSIVHAFDTVPGLSSIDRFYINSSKGGEIMRRVLVRYICVENFSNKLDESVDIFAVRNGVFDMVTKRFRPAVPEDCVSRHADWEYDADLAVKHRNDVEVFIKQILPIDEERKVVLSYCASLLSGRRRQKKFLACTDKRSGDNGKSTLIQLFEGFMDVFGMKETKFVCKGAFDKGRDNHDAGLHAAKGKRLIIAEELKHDMTLDVAMLKAYTGGSGIRVEGRKFGSESRFKFIWQAGFIIIFNEKDMPKFDSSDTAFLNRMIVVPMRSKFVTIDPECYNPELDEEYTYPRLPAVSESFHLWYPALADILLEHYDEQFNFDSVPKSMRQWKADVADASNVLADWFTDTINITGNKKDVMLIHDCYLVYKAQSFSDDEIPNVYTEKAFRELLINYLATKKDQGCIVKDRTTWNDKNNKKCSGRWVVFGVVCETTEDVHIVESTDGID